jgi:extracellular elastinolytic metalloproteinase
MKKTLLAYALIISAFSHSQNIADISNYKQLILSENTGLKVSDISEIKLSSQSFDSKNQVTHLYFNQYFKQIPVHNAVLGLHLDKNNRVITLNHSFVKNLESFSSSTTPALSPEIGVSKALNFNNTNVKIEPNSNLPELISTNEQELIFKDPSHSQGNISLKLTWLFKDNKFHLCYNVNWLTADEQNWWNVRVDAQTGQILDYDNWVAQCQLKGSHSTHNHQIPSVSSPTATAQGSGAGSSNASYNVFARPVESPSHGSRTLLTDPSDSLASPFSWHDDNGQKGHEYTITRGNNVYASEDKDNNNSPGYSPDGGTNLKFDYTFDKTKKHSDYLDAAITNLFYWNNAMHDVWYHYGFDDASGNFQFNNYGRGGSGSDEVMAEAQDGSGTNNANFATPPDGQNPRMQMYVWNVSSTSFLLRVLQPSSLARQYVSVLAGFGPKLTTTPITGKLVLVDDGSSSPTSLGCQTLINGSSISGQIALVDRGNCSFLEKVQFAQDAGAKAVIVINNVTTNLITMGGTGGSGITIPSIMISKADGDNFKNAIKTQQVTVSLYDSLGAAGKQYDSDFDNGVICHEYGHGISNRLTGGAANTSCLTNQEQMGEGWSDFFGLVMTHEPNDKGTDKRGIGTYVIDEANDGNGIRNYPYSTSMSINPVTYNNIKTFSVPHGVGSVWCSMLWDMYWDMIAKYGYDPDIYEGTGGNNIAMKLVIDGMKLQPCNPGFTDARNAILLADQINNKGKNQELIWKSFARRGLGATANQGSSASRTDGTQAFDIPKFDLPSISKTTLPQTRNGDTLIYQIVIKNTNTNTLKNLTFSDTFASGLKYIKSLGCLKSTFNSPVFQGSIDSLRSGDSVVCKLYARVISPDYTSFLETTDFESGDGSWKDSTITGAGIWNFNLVKRNSGGKSFYLPNAGSQSDKVLTKTFNLNSAKPHLVFYHFYNTEDGWDGAVVEINQSGLWEDLGPKFIENGYNTQISVNDKSGISGRQAFSGNSKTFIRSIIDLSTYTGNTVKIRFRFASDALQGGDGWYLDDISLIDNYIKISNKATVNTSSGSLAMSQVSSMVLQGEKTSVKLSKLSNFKVMPNPFTNEIRLETSSKNYTIYLMDVMGKTVLRSDNLNNNQIIETSSLAKGTYFLKIVTENGIEVIKLLK